MKAHQKEKKSQRLRVLLLALAPLTGLLPAYEQILIQNEMGISGLRLTFISAACTLFIGGLSFIFLVVAALAGAYGVAGPRFHLFYLGGTYLFFESLLRIYSAFKLEEPMGSLLLWLPVTIARQLFWPPKHPAVINKQLENDEIRTVEGKDYDLEIISLLPKPHWNPRTGIQFEGIWYGMINSQILQEGKERRYKFLLKKAPDNYSFRTTSIYTRDEINQLMRQRRRLELSTWVNTFAPLWGLLNRADQERLEALYDFDALKFSFITIVSLTALAFFNAVACIANLMSGRATRLDHILLLPTLYFLVEEVARLISWKKGEPSGSILGVLARPFASRLLQ
jgi:hypothetical protein